MVSWPAFADNAKRRDGGSTSSSGSAGARHHDSGGSQSSARSGGSSSSSSNGGGAQLTDAQRRHPRAGTGSGYRRHGRGGGYYYYPYYRSYYRPYGYYGYGYDPFYFGFGSYYGGGYYPHHYGGYGYAYRDTGSLRVQVDPSKTRVYVDGYYAGVADEFDGLFQRLHVSPGRHEITLKLEGYQSHRVKVYAAVGNTVKLHHDMVKGSSDQVTDATIGDPERDERQYLDRERLARDRDDRDDRARERAERYDRIDRERDDADRDAVAGEKGTLRLSLRPDDASVYVDGEFRGSARQLGRLSLGAGRHRVELVRPGYRTVEREVEVEAGGTVDLDVELERL
jgi:hypothetical protein